MLDKIDLPFGVNVECTIKCTVIALALAHTNSGFGGIALILLEIMVAIFGICPISMMRRIHTYLL